MRLMLLFSLVLCAMNDNLHSQDFIQGPFTSEVIGSPQVADFNGDGKVDILGIEYGFGPPNPLNLFINTSTDDEISFDKVMILAEASGIPGIGDEDVDGDMDIRVSTLADGSSIYHNDRSAGFSRMPFSSVSRGEFELHDFNGDGEMDYIQRDIDDKTLAVLVKTSPGSLSSVLFVD